MYKIIGGDKKEYGPVEAELLRQWYAEGRVNGQTLVQAVGSTDWRPLETFPELASITAPPPIPPPQMGAAPAFDSFAGGGAMPSERDYDLDIGGCVGNAWALYKKDFGLLFGALAVFFLIQGGIGLLGQIPLIGLVISLVSIVLGGPFMGGLYFFLLRAIRGEPAEIGDIFAGFKINFGHLILVYLVMALMLVAMIIPGGALAGFSIYSMTRAHEVGGAYLAMAIVGSLVALLPFIYFSVAWYFAIPLVIDKGMDFWGALNHSRRMVSKHWWSVFGLLVVHTFINILGVLACCIGIFLSAPLAFATLAYGYEKIFNGSNGSTAVAY